MDRLPSVGNGYVAPREAGPGRRSHMQGGADRTAWTRLSTVLLSDDDGTPPHSRRGDISQATKPATIHPNQEYQFASRSPMPFAQGPPCARNGAGHL